MIPFLTGDQHFGHANVLKYCNRNFYNVETHDEELIKAWNSVVGKDDDVIHLGDLTLSGGKFAADIISRLNGNIFILGNHWHHDKRWLLSPEIFHFVDTDKLDIMTPLWILEKGDYGNDIPIVLCHYAFEVWDRKHYGALHFHGHSHGELPPKHNRLDVGVDNAYKLTGEYRPLRLDEACEFAFHIP